MSEEPISLYLALEPGAVADLEVVAAASLAFVQAIREVAFIIDPSIEVRVELASGLPGSLSLNSLIRDLKDPEKRKKTLVAVGLLIASWLGNDTRQWLFDKGMDKVISDKETEEHHFSDGDIVDIINIYERAKAADVGRPQREKIYRELERDPAISGVGASRTPGVPPPVIIPKSQFRHEAGLSAVSEETILKRTVPSREWVTIISPVLVDSHRRWKFERGGHEFGAPINDHSFLEQVLAGRSAVPMQAGVQLDVDLEVYEEKQGGVWVRTGYAVTHVYDATPSIGPRNRQLPLPDERNTDADQ